MLSHFSRLYRHLFGSRKARRPERRPCSLQIETLEKRELMAANLTATLLPDGLLRVEGTEGNDTIMVRQDAGRISVANLSIAIVGSDGDDVLHGDSIVADFDAKDWTDGMLAGRQGWTGGDIPLSSENSFLGGRVLDGLNWQGPSSFVSVARNLNMPIGEPRAVLSFDAYAGRLSNGRVSHNSGVYLDDSHGHNVSWWFNQYSNSWHLDARSLTGDSQAQIIVPGGYNTKVRLQIVLDYENNQVFGRFNFGQGDQETARIPVNPDHLRRIHRTFMSMDYRYQNLGHVGIQVANLSLRTDTGPQTSVAASQVKRIEVFGLGGDDVIRLDQGTQPITAPAVLDGGKGTDLLAGGGGRNSFALGTYEADKAFRHKAGDDLHFSHPDHVTKAVVRSSDGSIYSILKGRDLFINGQLGMSNVRDFAFGSQGTSLRLDTDGVLHRYASGAGWVRMDSNITAFQVRGDGRIFVLKTNGTLLGIEEASPDTFWTIDTGVAKFEFNPALGNRIYICLASVESGRTPRLG